MSLSRSGLAAAALLALAMSGCQSSRMSSIDTQPEPLPPAPSGNVTQNKLPPPKAAEAAAFPSAPGAAAGADASAGTQVAANAPNVTAGSIAGVWNATVAGQTCKIATPQTKFGQGFRAGPLRCPAPMDGVKSWSVSGKQLVLYDEGGSSLARLYASGADRFDGQTQSGQPISFTR